MSESALVTTASSAGLRTDPEANQGVLADVRLLDFGIAIFLAAHAAIPFLPVVFPTSYLAIGVLLAVASMRRPRWPLTPVNALVWLFVLLLGYYAVVSATGVQSSGEGDWARRLFRMALLVAFVGAAASGRLHLPSVIKGFAVGLAANAVLFYVGLAPRPYGDFLTGFAGDKNAAGLVYATIGLLLLATLTSKRERVAVFLAMSALVFLTGSRTSMAGITAAMVWILVASRLQTLPRLGVGALLVWGLNVLEEGFARSGVFADRTGTDWFREQIAQAVSQKVAVTPPQGMGLGEAYVVIPQGQFYFHNSFHTLFVEGGYVGVAVVVGVTVLLALPPFRVRDVAWSERVVEGTAVALLVCAWQLGEVFLTVSWGVLLAAALRLRLMGSGGMATLQPDVSSGSAPGPDHRGHLRSQIDGASTERVRG